VACVRVLTHIVGRLPSSSRAVLRQRTPDLTGLLPEGQASPLGPGPGRQHTGNMEIRPEAPNDVPAIRAILIAAFASHPHSHQTEHLLVEALRSAGALAVALVATLDDRPVGHIAFSKVEIDGKPSMWFGLAPIAVLPRCQKQGIGHALVLAGLEALANLGAHGCVLLGSPDYYHRFGFRADPALRLGGVPPEYFLALPFPGRTAAGIVSYHPAFSVC